jgi:hypothetical protein
MAADGSSAHTCSGLVCASFTACLSKPPDDLADFKVLGLLQGLNTCTAAQAAIKLLSNHGAGDLG